MAEKPTYEALEKRIRDLEKELQGCKETERSLNLWMENSPSVAFTKDLDGRLTYVNRSFEMLFSFKPGEILGQTDFDLYPNSPDTAKRMQANDCQVVETREPSKFEEAIIAQGETRYFETLKFPLQDSTGQAVGVAGMAIDITERKQIEQKLRETLLRLEEAVSAGNIGLWDWDLNTNKVSFSREWKKQIGYEDHEISDDFNEWESRVHPEDLKATLHYVKGMIEQKVQNYQTEFRFRHKDGSYRWMMAQASIRIDESGNPFRVLGSHVDITERKQAQEERRESEERFRVAQDMSPDGFTILRPVRDDQDQVIDFAWVYENESVARMNGTDPQKVVGQRLLELFPGHQGTQFFNAYKQVAETGESITFEDKYVGETIRKPTWFRIVVVPMAENIAIMNQDITERKQAEDELLKVKALLDSASRMAKVGGWEVDANTHEVNWTDETYRIHEVPIGHKPPLKEAINFFHPEDRPRLEQAIERALSHGAPYDMEIRFITAKGNQLWTRTICHPHTENGKVVKLLGTFQDITDRKRAEESLKAIEWLIETSPTVEYEPKQYYGDLTDLNTERTILDGVGAEVLSDIVSGYLELLDTAAAIYERNGDYAHGIFASGYCRMLDASSRRLCGTDDNAAALSGGKWLCHESCWERASKVSIQSGKPVDVECDGGIRLYAVPIVANGRAVGSINFGYGDPPEDMQRIEQIAEKYQIDAKALLNEAEKYESRPRFIIEIAKKRLESSARLIGALVESKTAQKELQKERERLNVTLQSIGDGVITTDVEGKVVLLNRVAETLTGWSQKDSIGREIEEIFHIVNEHTRERCENPVKKVLETGSIIGLANDTVLLARDGAERVIADSGAPIVDPAGNTGGVVLVFRDVTEKIKLETELRHGRKMEAIGNLAGGIAHEFNNVLGIIIGNAELGIDDLGKWHPVAENLKEIKTASLRAKDVVKQLLTFSRKMDMKREPVDVRIIVKETLKLLRATIPSSIKIREVLPENTDHVVSDPTQIHQLFINLCNNAAQAMSEEGGILTIELSNVTLDYEAASKHPDLQPGAYVRFSVSDTGCGIPADLLDKVFDPYFTTKEVGKGTGMGLAVVHGIVKAHNGTIDIESASGKGTAFHIHFPASREKAYQEETNLAALPTGKERILFIDDEISIVRLGDRILSQLGYSVTSDTDPIHILDLFRTSPDKYDLVISDMTMPDMTGDRLAKELLNIRSDVPIIISTGFSEKMSPEMAEEMGIRDFLMKPVIRDELARTVRKVLDEEKLRKQFDEEVS